MGRKNRKTWSKKKAKGGGGGDGSDPRDGDTYRLIRKATMSNVRMEAYYALQGLHDTHMCLVPGTGTGTGDSAAAGGRREEEEEEEAATFVPCATDAEREAERIKWITSLRTILPASFRLGTDLDPDLRARLASELDGYAGREIEIEMGAASTDRRNWGAAADAHADADAPTKVRVAPAARIRYVPHAYQTSLDRRTIKRNPALSDFHDWLVEQTAAGFLTRQETVSMIPPVVLAPRPGDAVLDMCAAPGSKTSQLLETVAEIPGEGEGGGGGLGATEPTGFVVANDSDAKRAYLLTHQLRRINSPAVYVCVVEAQRFPLPGGTRGARGSGEEGAFDRVLCDVPCSGDGTTRKNPGMWKHWSQHGALALHPLQVSIALNGCRLTKVGGYMCYSTCSMNPIENEAAVAQILREAEGAVELVDRRPDLPGLRARPGWSTWRVLREDMDPAKNRRGRKNAKNKNSPKMQQRRKEWEEKRAKEAAEAAAGEEAEAGMGTIPAEGGADGTGDAAMADTSKVGGEEKKADGKEKEENGGQKQNAPRAQPRVFAAPEAWDEDTLVALAKDAGLVEHKSIDSVPEEWRKRVRESCFPPTAEEAERFHLERCMRCLPHDMDTGGFFVALFKKVAPMRARARKAGKEAEGGEVADTAACGAAEEKGEPEEKRRKVGEAAAEDEPSEKLEAKKQKTDLGSENFVECNQERFPPIVDFYGLTGSFPKDQIMARSNGDSKSLYFITRAVKERLLDLGIQERITTISSGVKAFERQKNQECICAERIAQEGIHFVVPFMTRRKILADPADFIFCLRHGGLKLGENFSPGFAEQMKALSLGSFVVALRGHENSISRKMFLSMWRCKYEAVNCLVAKVEIDGMKSKLRALGIDVPKEVEVKEKEDGKAAEVGDGEEAKGTAEGQEKMKEAKEGTDDGSEREIA